MGRGGHAPFRRAVVVHHRQAGLHHVGGEGGVPEHLLRDVALRRNRTSLTKGHALGFGRGELLQPVDRLGHGIDRGRVVGRATARHAGTDGLRLFVDADAPFVNRQAVRLALVAHAGHRHPRIGIAPAERGVFLAVVHVAVDARGRSAHIGHVAAGEELGDVLIGRPVDRNAQVIAILGLEVVLGLLVVEPVIAEPVKVGELLVGQLIELAVRRRGEFGADEVGQIEAGVRDGGALTSHPVGQVAGLLIAPVGADQVAVVDIGVIDVFAGLHLRLQLFDHVTFTDQVMGDLDAGDRGEGGRQHLRFIFMRGDGFRHDLDLHTRIGLGRVDEPLHFLFLIGARQGGEVADFLVEEGFRGLHVGPGRHRECDERKRHRCCRCS